MPLLDVRDVVAYVRGAPLFAPLSFSADTGDVLATYGANGHRNGGPKLRGRVSDPAQPL